MIKIYTDKVTCKVFFGRKSFLTKNFLILIYFLFYYPTPQCRTMCLNGLSQHPLGISRFSRDSQLYLRVQTKKKYWLKMDLKTWKHPINFLFWIAELWPTLKRNEKKHWPANNINVRIRFGLILNYRIHNYII